MTIVNQPSGSVGRAIQTSEWKKTCGDHDIHVFLRGRVDVLPPCVVYRVLEGCQAGFDLRKFKTVFCTIKGRRHTNWRMEMMVSLPGSCIFRLALDLQPYTSSVFSRCRAGAP